MVARHLGAPEYTEREIAVKALRNNLTKLAERERRAIKADLEEQLQKARQIGDEAAQDEILRQLVELGRARHA